MSGVLPHPAKDCCRANPEFLGNFANAHVALVVPSRLLLDCDHTLLECPNCLQRNLLRLRAHLDSLALYRSPAALPAFLCQEPLYLSSQSQASEQSPAFEGIVVNERACFHELDENVLLRELLNYIVDLLDAPAQPTNLGDAELLVNNSFINSPQKSINPLAFLFHPGDGIIYELEGSWVNRP